MLRLIASTTLVILTFSVFAQDTNDSIKTRRLNEVVVQGQMQRTSATVSTYIPTSKQKTASQTGTDLLNRMGIPQLRLTFGDNGSVQTASGQDVDLFIDFQPASSSDLSGMRMTDVKKVEYYDYPDDPRFMGKAHVVNFVMQKYEYGGYLKAYASEFFIANAGQGNLYSKFQYKKMTFDLAVGAYYNNMPHSYNNISEIYRLPQPDGSIKQFRRISDATDSKFRRRYYWPTFKARYASDKVSLTNVIGTNFDHYPTKFNSGTVSYIPSDFQTSSYSSSSSNRANSITYSGYWNFILPKNNTINFAPYYSYSHTNQQSLYTETNASSIINHAKDNTHRVNGTLTFAHSFGKAGTLSILADATYQVNHTLYSGTSQADDKTTTTQFNPVVRYSLNTDRFYTQITAGWMFDRSVMRNYKESSNAPYIGLSLQYAPTNKHSINGYFSYSLSGGASGNNSTTKFYENPLLAYTGNPYLKPTKSYNGSLSYTWLPVNKFNLTVYGSIWALGNRAAYLYQASHTEILRTIIQPAGSYAQGSYGAYGTLRLIDNKLQLTAQLTHTIGHNGYPYNWTKNSLSYSFQAAYYAGSWNFGGYFISGSGYPDGAMVGTWMKTVSHSGFWAGWANSIWNLKCVITNPYRWNWKENRAIMQSQHYDRTETAYNSNAHCFVQLSATYTFGFGKKIEMGNEANQQTGVASGIMK